MTDCVFCDGASANGRVDESDRFLALADGNPISRGHALIVPRRHVESLFELADDEFAEAFGLLARVRKIVDAARKPDGYNIGINDGPAAGRTVHHLHIHLIPRYWGDVADPRGGVRLILPGLLPDAWAEKPSAARPTGRPPAYVSFSNMAWPHPDDPLEVEWSLRYGEPPRNHRLVAASYIAAYRRLIADTIAQRNRKVAGIRRAARALADRLKTGSR